MVVPLAFIVVLSMDAIGVTSYVRTLSLCFYLHIRGHSLNPPL